MCAIRISWVYGIVLYLRWRRVVSIKIWSHCSLHQSKEFHGSSFFYKVSFVFCKIAILSSLMSFFICKLTVTEAMAFKLQNWNLPTKTDFFVSLCTYGQLALTSNLHLHTCILANTSISMVLVCHSNNIKATKQGFKFGCYSTCDIW